MKEVRKIKTRIKELRRVLNLTQQEFADRIGVKRGVIGNFEAGRNALPDSIISLVCREFNVSESWLRKGEGSMFADRSDEEEIAYIVGQTLSDKSDQYRLRMVKAILQLSPEDLEALTKFAKALLKDPPDDS